MTAPHLSPAGRPTHPLAFLFLVAPFGIMAGYLTVTLAYVLSRAGVPAPQIAELIALSYLPHTWKFLWAPVVDATLTPRRWYLIATVASAAGIVAMGALPANAASMPLLTAVVIASNFAVTFLSMAVESLMAHATLPEQKGRAAGWFQAGNLGGVGLGGGLGLWLAEHGAAPWLPAVVLAALCLACGLPLLRMAGSPGAHRPHALGDSMKAVLSDLWSVARSRMGYLGLLICFLPIGSGAASNLWSVIAGDWKASADTVALVNGLFSGVVSAGGSIVGGYLCDRMDRKRAYALFGLAMAACAVGMALAPRTESMYVVFVMLYAFITGFCYAGFSAVVLEAIGAGAAATKYSLFASLSNMPIGYMTALNGWSYGKWGAATMLWLEAAIGVAALLVFLGVAAMSKRHAQAPVAQREAA